MGSIKKAAGVIAVIILIIAVAVVIVGLFRRDAGE